MAIVDEQTRVAMEITSQSAKLIENLLVEILKKLNGRFQEKGSKDIIINNDSKEGKQKLTELSEKYKGGISALPENIKKEQLKDYQKEFKKNGIDFSVVKNGKDNYSFYFASKDSEIMEKGIKNVVENKIEKEQTKEKAPARFSLGRLAELKQEREAKEKASPQKEKGKQMEDRER